MSSPNPKMHRALKLTIIDHLGDHDGGTAYVHMSRRCDNCAHDGLRDPEWVAEGGIEQFGRCMNVCSAADAEDVSNHFCDDHQSAAEFAAGRHRAHVPLLTVAEGGAA